MLTDPLINAIFDRAADAIVVIDKDSKIIWYNEKFLTLFKYTSEEVDGQTIQIIMPHSMVNEHLTRIKEYCETRKKHSDIIGRGRQVLARNKNNDIFPIYISVGESVVNDKIYFIGILHDSSILNQTKIEDDIDKLQRNLDAT